MRRTFLIAVVAAAIGFAGITVASAAPINPAPVNQAGAAVNDITHVQHWRWGSGRHWRWGSRGRW